MLAVALSRHAQVRANQRGITHEMIDNLITYADVEAPIPGIFATMLVTRRLLWPMARRP